MTAAVFDTPRLARLPRTMSAVDTTVAGPVVFEHFEPSSWARVARQDAEDVAEAHARWRSRIMDQG
jgi:hypothetical protein